ncbi:MAG: TIGR02266 family protein [Deltaproteobacteria bacterium]|nr:TIGR02266 family protein [Deltaproteobacteria bacterium]MBN2670622.1 TIGR02266 family protein [Deltaproteobacteria bacterium]
MNDKPKEKAAAIRAKLKYPSIEAFVQRYAQNVSKYGVFFKTSKPKPVGTTVKFELKIADDTTVLRGMGDVSWIRETEHGSAPAGMGIKFKKLDANSRDTVKKILVYKKSSVMGPSRYSEVPPPSDESALLAAAAKEAEEKAKKEAEEKAKKEAEEKAKKEAEEKAKKEAEEKARKAQRAKEKLEEEKRSGGKIEADEEEIDDIVAAFDSIQMPEETAASAVQKSEPVDEEDSDAVDADAADSNLDEALFADAAPAEASNERPSIADLLEAAPLEENTADDINPESLFIDEDPTDIDDLAEDPGEFDIAGTVDTPPRQEESLFADVEASDDSDDDDITDLQEDSIVEELSDDDLTEDSSDNLFGASSADDSLFVSQSAPETADDDDAPLETEDYIIEELTDDVEFIEEFDEFEDDEEVDFGAPENVFDNAPAVRPSDGFDHLVNEYSRGSVQPQPRPEPLLADNTLDNALNDIFQGNSTNTADRPKSEHEQQMDRISQLPDTLPDDALPDSLAEIMKRKSIAPHPARQSVIPSVPQQPTSQPNAGTLNIPVQQNPAGDFANAGMPGQQSQWGGGPNAGMPGQQSQWGSGQNTGMPGQQSQWGGGPNAGMPGQQSQWGNSQSSEDYDDDLDMDKRKGFFGKLFGK